MTDSLPKTPNVNVATDRINGTQSRNTAWRWARVSVLWLSYAYARAAAGHVDLRRCRLVLLASSHSSRQLPFHN